MQVHLKQYKIQRTKFISIILLQKLSTIMCTVDVYTSKSYMVHEYCVRVINNITLPGELVYT